MSREGPWDIGSNESDVSAVLDYTHEYTDDDYDCDSSRWGRTVNGEWKGYKNGGKVYLDWSELARRWGPLHSLPAVPGGTENGTEGAGT